MTPSARVTFAPGSTAIDVAVGSTVLDAARAAGIVVPAACGGRGICGSCALEIVEGVLDDPDPSELGTVERARRPVRLACRARVVSDVTVRLLMSQAQAAAPTPTEAGELFGAVDLGTTNVAAALVDPTGRRVGQASVPNQQQTWGADVLSRLSAALSGQGGELAEAAQRSVEAALLAAGLTPQAHLRRVVVAGNTSMASLLVGADVSALATHPFSAPTIPREPAMHSIQADADEWLVLPPIGGFVGGDTLAGLVHAGMMDPSVPTLLVDFGTNAEIALFTSDSGWVASAPAGPAFEGGGIECGSPVLPGAVTHVSLVDDALALTTFGGAQAASLTGAGLVSLVAVLVRAGHIDAEGRLNTTGPVERSFFSGEDGVLRLALTEDRRLWLSQKDIRSFQLAKAAVRTGVEFVIRRSGIGEREIGKVYIAGAFGAALDREDLTLLGVLPAYLAKMSAFVGNASLEGALELALEPSLIEEMTAGAGSALHIELAEQQGFNETLLAALSLKCDLEI